MGSNNFTNFYDNPSIEGCNCLKTQDKAGCAIGFEFISFNFKILKNSKVVCMYIPVQEKGWAL